MNDNAPGNGPERMAIVTGASSGIGAALARELAGRGTTVALVARRAERLEEVLADCVPGAPESRAYPADLAEPERAAELARRIWDDFGAIDVLVNNAGIPLRRPVQRVTMDEVRRAMTVNYLSPVAMTLALLPRMLERGRGVIVNVSSLGGRLGIPTEAAYCGSKFALCGWSESMAADLSGTGVSVRLVLPGAIDTEIWDQPGNDSPVYDGPKEPPEGIAAGIADAIDGTSFEHYIPDLKPIIEAKTADFDSFLVGMAAMSEGTADGQEMAARMKEAEREAATSPAGGSK
ncbi:MAG: SDR family NAD(P)-dependent oxidoreductase [Acidimicrobiales bacterium]